MAFTISLYSNSSPPNTVSKNISKIADLSGVLREEASVIDPAILIEADASILSKANYIYITELSRYYYIREIVSIRNNLWSVSAHVDVLMSWKSQLLNNSGVVNRQQNRWNLYLDDGVFKAYQDPLIKTIEFPSGFTTPEYVLAIAGAEDDTP